MSDERLAIIRWAWNHLAEAERQMHAAAVEVGPGTISLAEAKSRVDSWVAANKVWSDLSKQAVGELIAEVDRLRAAAPGGG